MKCKKCGKKLKRQSRFCNFCGTKVVKAPAEKKGLKAAKKSKVHVKARASVTVIIITVVACVVLAAMFFITRNGHRKLDFSRIKKLEFGICGSIPKDMGKMAGAEVKDIRTNASFERLFDIAVTADGSELFLADADKGTIFILSRKGEASYKTRTSFLLAGRNEEKQKGQLCYLTIDEKGKRIFVIDCSNGTLSEYDWNGVFKKKLATSDRLYGTRSIRYQDYGGGTLVTSVPPKNSVIIYDTNGAIKKEYPLASGMQCDNFIQPCYAAIDGNSRLFVVDSGNKATKIFKLPEMKFEKAITNEGCSTVMGPQLVLFDAASIPYFGITSKDKNAVVFSTKDGSQSVSVSLVKDGPNGFNSPTAMAADASGNIYVISPSSKKAVMVKLSGTVFK